MISIRRLPNPTALALVLALVATLRPTPTTEGSTLGLNPRTAPIVQSWEGLLGPFATEIDAAVELDEQTVMVLSADALMIHTADGQTAGPHPRGALGDWPRNWTQRIDAALRWDAETVFLFRGTELLTLDIASEAITGGAFWNDWPEHWNGGIDAAVRWSDRELMFFRGAEWQVVDLYADEPGNVYTVDQWHGWPTAWSDGIDAAVNPGDGLVYFFRDGEVLPYLVADQMFVPSYPRPLSGTVAAMLDRSRAPLPMLTPKIQVEIEMAETETAETETIKVSTTGGETEQLEGTLEKTEAMEDNQEIESLENSEDTQITAVIESQETQETHETQEASFTARLETTDGDFNPALLAHDMGKHSAGEVIDEGLGTREASPQTDPDHYWDATPTATGPDMREWMVQPQPNIDWLGAGFDIVYVDPTNYAAGGCARCGRRPNDAFELALSKERTPDNLYLLHRGTRRHSNAQTQGEKSREVIESIDDFRHNFSHSFGAGITIPDKVAFSGSASFQRMNDQKTGKDHIYIYNHDRRDGPTLYLDTTWEESGVRYRQRLSSKFRQQVDQLPEMDASCRRYERFLADFGTHFARQVTFGGLFNITTKISKNLYEQSTISGASFGARAAQDIRQSQMVANRQSDLVNGQAESGFGDHHLTQKVSEHSKRWSTGGNGHEDYGTWVTSVDANPMPIDIEFSPFTELLDTRFFPNDPMIESKQYELQRCTERYLANEGLKYPQHPGGGGFYERRPRQYRVTVDTIASNGDLTYFPLWELKAEVLDAKGDSKRSRLLAEARGHTELRGTTTSPPGLSLEVGGEERHWYGGRLTLDGHFTQIVMGEGVAQGTDFGTDLLDAAHGWTDGLVGEKRPQQFTEDREIPVTREPLGPAAWVELSGLEPGESRTAKVSFGVSAEVNDYVEVSFTVDRIE